LPAIINCNLCDGCKGNPEPPCVRICPGDVLEKDFGRELSRVRDSGECWDCYACVKACPRNAIQVELSYALARRKGKLLLIEHTTAGALWEIQWPDGKTQRVLRPAHVSVLDDAENVGKDVFMGFGI